MLIKFIILFFAWVAVVLGVLVMGVSRIIEDAHHQQHRIIHQQMKDSHELHNWRLK